MTEAGEETTNQIKAQLSVSRSYLDSEGIFCVRAGYTLLSNACLSSAPAMSTHFSTIPGENLEVLFKFRFRRTVGDDCQ